MCVLIAQLCLTLCDPMVHSLPGYSIHGILQVRILKWVAIAFSKVPSQSRMEPRSATLQTDSLPSGEVLMYYFSTYVLYIVHHHRK